MALSNINYDLSVDEQAIVLAINNNPDILTKVFQGLFIAARRHIGYSPRGNSFPFITQSFPAGILKNSFSCREEIAFSQKYNIVVVPDINQKFKNREICTLSIKMDRKIIYDAIEEINLNLDNEDIISTHSGTHNITAITMAVIENKWDDMVIFAKQSPYYMRSWQTVAYNLRTTKD
jgi:hypothetical protein